jgi:hypothetical protein
VKRTEADGNLWLAKMIKHIYKKVLTLNKKHFVSKKEQDKVVVI